MSALLGTFVSIKTMADGSPRITLDLQCTLAEAAALGLAPGAAFGIARITGESTIAPAPAPEPASEKIGPLCLLAIQFGKDPQFREWIGASDEATAKALILAECNCTSRRQLDSDPYFAGLFQRGIRAQFMAWRDAR